MKTSLLFEPTTFDDDSDSKKCRVSLVTRGSEINKTMLKKTKPYFYSPAEIVNLYVSNKDDEQAFLKRLIQNKKVIDRNKSFE